MPRAPLRSLLVALHLAACAAHGRDPDIDVPEADPPLAEWDGPEIPEALVAAHAEAAAYASGERDALAAIRSGELALATYGAPADCSKKYDRLLWRRHRVAVRRVAGCNVDMRTFKHVEGFNTVMASEIGRRFGADALDAVAREAGCSEDRRADATSQRRSP